MEDGELWRKKRKIGLNGRDQGGVGGYCFRQLPRTSGDIRGMGGSKLEDGRWEIMRKTEKNWNKWKKPGMGGGILLPSDSVSFRGRPWISAACVDGRRKMEAGKL